MAYMSRSATTGNRTIRNGTTGAISNGGRASYSKTNRVSYVTGGANSNQVLSINRTDSPTFSGITDPTTVWITNTGEIPIIVMLGYESYTSETADSAVVYQHAMLLPGEVIHPPMRAIISLQGSNTTSTHGSFADQSLYNLDTTALDWTAPSDDLKADSGANVKNNTLSNTTDPVSFGVTVSGADSKYIRVGDLIRIENEIMEVLGTYEDDPTNSSLVVGDIRCKRGVYGSTNASHTDDPDIYFPYFNTHHEFDKFTSALAPGATAGYCQTDNSGRYASKNFFGLGRNSGDAPMGIQPGSVCLRFYSQGTHGLGTQGLVSSTNSGLAVSTEYKFNIAINGGTARANLAFTTDSANVNWGGTNGVISKIQAALDAEYYDAGSNLFETQVVVGLVGGDLVFRSVNNLSTSAVLLAAPGSGTTPFGVGRLPAIGSVQTAITAKLPEGADLVTYDPITYRVRKNSANIAYDRGDGTITGVGGITGNINYETGEWNIIGAPPNANFEYSVIHNTPFSGKRDSQESARANSLVAIHANVMNAKMDGILKVDLI